ncbi:hypothetical protein LXL04_018343 [Taraxacum kok-saghyz]
MFVAFYLHKKTIPTSIQLHAASAYFRLWQEDHASGPDGLLGGTAANVTRFWNSDVGVSRQNDFTERYSTSDTCSHSFRSKNMTITDLSSNIKFPLFSLPGVGIATVLAGKKFDLAVEKVAANILATPGSENEGMFIIEDISVVGLQVAGVDYVSVKSFNEETPPSDFQKLVTLEATTHTNMTGSEAGTSGQHTTTTGSEAEYGTNDWLKMYYTVTHSFSIPENVKFLPMRLNIVSGNCYDGEITDLRIDGTTSMRLKLLDFVLSL